MNTPQRLSNNETAEEIRALRKELMAFLTELIKALNKN